MCEIISGENIFHNINKYYENNNNNKKSDFDLNYDPDKYWIPDDCDKSINKRPEYQQGILY